MEKVKEIMTPKRIIILVIVGLFILFASLNFDKITINMLFFRINIPLFFLIIVLGGVGFLAGFLTKRNRDEQTIKSLKKQLSQRKEAASKPKVVAK